MDWKRSIDIAKYETLGLDIGSSTVKMVALRHSDEGFSAVAAGIAEIAESKEENQRQRANTIKAIRQCFARTRVQRKLAVCGVSGPDVAVRDFKLSSVPAEEMAVAVSYEASQVCPFPAEDSAVDYQLTTTDGIDTTGVLVAAMNDLVEDRRQLVKEARLKCVLMDVEGLALLNCYKGLTNGDDEADSGGTVAILNVGGSSTTLAIMDSDGRPFVRDMLHGGIEIITQIAAETRAPIETIEGLLSADLAVIDSKLRESLEGACQGLLSDVKETLRYYVAQGITAGLNEILVCGGFALSGAFIELLNDRLGTRCGLWNPFDRMQCNPDRRYKDIFAKTGPVLAVAAGLAMRSA